MFLTHELKWKKGWIIYRDRETNPIKGGAMSKLPNI